MIRAARLSRIATLDEYYGWLCDLVGACRGGPETYMELMGVLHSKIFRWYVPNDDNRAFDGEALRELFCDDNDIYYDEKYFDFDCTMLELIVALARRCEDIMVDQECDLEFVGWFWKILSNIKLDKFTDEDFYDLGGPKKVDEILEKVISRLYKPSGFGGLFPLRFAKKDQRRVEIWYQMNAYLVENYYFEEEIM